jgi:hypothetical protein
MTPDRAVSERRFVQFWLTDRAVLFTFKGIDEGAEFVSMPVADIPGDALVVSVHNDYATGCFLTVASMTFDPVPQGMMPPRAQVKHKTVRLKKAEKQ